MSDECLYIKYISRILVTVAATNFLFYLEDASYTMNIRLIKSNGKVSTSTQNYSESVLLSYIFYGYNQKKCPVTISLQDAKYFIYRKNEYQRREGIILLHSYTIVSSSPMIHSLASVR